MLGHRISKNGISPDPGKVAIITMSEPTNVPELRRMLTLYSGHKDESPEKVHNHRSCTMKSTTCPSDGRTSITLIIVFFFSIFPLLQWMHIKLDLVSFIVKRKMNVQIKLTHQLHFILIEVFFKHFNIMITIEPFGFLFSFIFISACKITCLN